jgi:hypothetical protein
VATSNIFYKLPLELRDMALSYLIDDRDVDAQGFPTALSPSLDINSLKLSNKVRWWTDMRSRDSRLCMLPRSQRFKPGDRHRDSTTPIAARIRTPPRGAE